MNKPKLCILQTGRLGDTIIALPIAKYYFDLGYQVDWIIHEYVSKIFDYIDYIENLYIIRKEIDIVYSIPYAYQILDQNSYDKIIDLSIGFPGTRISANHECFFKETFVHSKYFLADISIDNLWNLTYNRNTKKENELYHKLIKNKDYILVHNTIEHGKVFDIESEYDIIYFERIEDYQIFDWRTIIENAKEIHCTDSSLINYIDKLDIPEEIFLYQYMENRTNNKWLNPPLRKKWKRKE